MAWVLHDMVEVYFLLSFSWCVLILRGSKGTGSTCSPVTLCLSFDISFFFVLFYILAISPPDKLWNNCFSHNVLTNEWVFKAKAKAKFICLHSPSFHIIFQLLPGKNPSLGLALPVLDNPCFANHSAPDWKQGWHRTWQCVLQFNIGDICFLSVYR